MPTKCVADVRNEYGQWLIMEKITPGYKPWFLVKKRIPTKDESWWFWPRYVWRDVEQCDSLDVASAFVSRPFAVSLPTVPPTK